jgi:hypothetical protein
MTGSDQSIRISFTEEVWLYPSETAAWHFVTLPLAQAQKVRRATMGRPRAGFGSVRVEATIGRTSWKTSVFPDTHSKSYILPLKAAVRKKEGVYAKDHVRVMLKIEGI